MPEYVYALFDFAPENPDEIYFEAGDRIEVIEKDDVYSDGWDVFLPGLRLWRIQIHGEEACCDTERAFRLLYHHCPTSVHQYVCLRKHIPHPLSWFPFIFLFVYVSGRTATGRVGLFPQSFTTHNIPEATPASPAIEVHRPEPEVHSPTVLQTLREEPETGSIGSPNVDPPGNSTPRITDGEVMHATMTDVQKAIEQLGRHDADGSRSFSFVSSHGGDGDWTDRESTTDTDGETDGWHLNARQRLAENSRVVNEELAEPSTPMRISALPIEVELSDESETEDGEHTSRLYVESSYPRRHPHIPEEEEDDAQPSIKAKPSNLSADPYPGTPVVASDAYIVPSPGAIVDDLPTATISGKTFLMEQDQRPRVASPEPDLKPAAEPEPEVKIEPQPEQASPAEIPLPKSPSPVNDGFLSSPPSTPPPVSSVQVSSAALANTPPERTRTPIFQPPGTPSSSTITSIGIQQALGTPSKPQFPFWAQSSETPPLGDPAPSSLSPKLTAEWTIEEVVDWLKGKGIDQSTCDKFIEQDITGDVLLELDLELLKTEIGIVAFGKRKRIVNAIAELKKPPPIPEPEPTAHSESLFSHSRSISSAQESSLNSPSVLSSGAPPISATGSQTLGKFYQSDSPGVAGDTNSLSPDTPKSTRFRRVSDPGSIQENAETLNRVSSRNSIIGLGIQLTSKFQRSRPSQLNLSPSDGNLGGKNNVSPDNVVTLEDDRTAMSESEIPNTGSSRNSKGRKSFRRPFESNGSLPQENGENGKDASSTPISLTSTKRDSIEEPGPLSKTHRRAKRSFDNTKPSERLSLFGTIGGSLGKSRKPPPRYSAGSTDREDDGVPGKGEKEKSTSTFSRLYHIADRKSSISRHNFGEFTAKQTALDKAKSSDAPTKPTKEDKDRTLLRKRNSGGEVPKSPVPAPPSNGPSLIQGRSVLEQIGTPDFNGWLMKRGEHYHIWKDRYCVLKGHNFYWMRSNNATETKIKGYINVSGYKITPDEDIKPGNYGFKMEHPNDKTHMFYSDTQSVIREWMKALMKSTIERDYSKPVSSTATVPTIPLDVAQAMSPSPRPPSPGARAATQRAMRRQNPNQLSSRDAQVLLLGAEKVKGDVKENGGRVESFFPGDHIPSPIEIPKSNSYDATSTKSVGSTVPPRPSRNRQSSVIDSGSHSVAGEGLINWANGHLPSNLQFTDISDCGGLNLMRIAESIKGKSASPPVLDSSFPSRPNDDRLDGLFSLFDFLLNNDVHLGTVSINDIRQCRKDKIIQLLKALKSWEDKRTEISRFLNAGTGLGYNSKPYLSTAGGLVWTPVM
ncbi:hypothetical protein BDM02DRAFT_3182935 [Thelephora ganbajun]|uniref:Uncharacterized protein n=1 Tax=Thelephora ganbajun TaxID=370292 RepID=A0ACB6ZWC1_THEGA|nr:hypothetical protein BDM02DRAFT_3182935 [Thelephora ganbajun]